MNEKLGAFERTLSVLGSLASILGVSAFSVFAIINSFKEFAANIGIRILLSGVALMFVFMFSYPVSLFVKMFISSLFSPQVYLDSENEDDIKYLNKLTRITIAIILAVLIIILIGLLIVIWSYNFNTVEN
ncbi:hypothetical protein AWH56_005280 [Anaerobacillus isosaccharinicus]|uniref:Uncharacterized protein n=1 Tax=Anaerobacillus isosaccharinicus TaxID=1532552 RepID=A0A1S2L9W7_9BACI|nr:hypothetical protein [Anaerobacillus isosaccharinicus]MBA5584561.1 hypothetical protein [Anaerobacillus isosaccharinicus]QOY37056.1 hypothetical protein AWH56_005280 [Anaerobacillus isosaccharinicus]